MHSGIYLLRFTGLDSIYIGRSKNINLRYSQHKASFKSGKCSTKLHEAYLSLGMPSIEILELAPENLLEELERKYILEFNSVERGLNTRKSTSGGHSGLWGEANGRSKYTNEQIIDVLFLLISDIKLTYPTICVRTGVPKSTIVDIANGTGHTWLSEYFPVEYAQLMSYRHRSNTRRYLLAVSPTGEVFTVEHLTEFCNEHRLQTGNMSRLLRGKCKNYGGWTAKASEK